MSPVETILAKLARCPAHDDHAIGADLRHDIDQKWDKVIDELLAARLLSDDWDGQGAKAPTTDAVDTSLQLVNTLKKTQSLPPNDYGPSVNGVITLGWHSETGSIVIEVTSPLRIEGYRWTRLGEKAVRFLLFQKLD